MPPNALVIAISSSLDSYVASRVTSRVVPSLYSATTRTDAEGLPAGGWRPEELLTPFEALRGFTLDAAHAGFAEEEVGSLEVGKRADFVVLGQDPLAIPSAQLRSLEVRATYVDGRRVFAKP